MWRLFQGTDIGSIKKNSGYIFTNNILFTKSIIWHMPQLFCSSLDLNPCTVCYATTYFSKSTSSVFIRTRHMSPPVPLEPDGQAWPTSILPPPSAVSLSHTRTSLGVDTSQSTHCQHAHHPPWQPQTSDHQDALASRLDGTSW